jgi:hypothetical protein
MTKEQLREAYGVPKEEDFETEEQYIEAKELWIQANLEKYEEILGAPSE